jgi:hypothetical protein
MIRVWSHRPQLLRLALFIAAYTVPKIFRLTLGILSAAGM